MLHEAALLADKIKSFEKTFSLVLPASQPYVVRLDGVSFKRLTTGMAKPFDPRFIRAMLLTARDLLENSFARTAFCQSDEITLVFGPESNQHNYMYGGRISKIGSVLASMASARFNHHIASFPDSVWYENPPLPHPQVLCKVKEGKAFFDARVFSVPDSLPAMESVNWRHKFDCRRNAVNSVGFHVLGHMAMEKLPMSQVLLELKHNYNIDPFTAFSKAAMFGVFLKKIQYEGYGINPLTGEKVSCIRTTVEARSFDWEGTAQERSDLVMDKFWQPHHPRSLEAIDIE